MILTSSHLFCDVFAFSFRCRLFHMFNFSSANLFSYLTSWLLFPCPLRLPFARTQLPLHLSLTTGISKNALPLTSKQLHFLSSVPLDSNMKTRIHTNRLYCVCLESGKYGFHRMSMCAVVTRLRATWVRCGSRAGVINLVRAGWPRGSAATPQFWADHLWPVTSTSVASFPSSHFLSAILALFPANFTSLNLVDAGRVVCKILFIYDN